MITIRKTSRFGIGAGAAIALALCAILLALLVLRIFFIGFYRIPQNGMYPGLPAGSRLLTVRHAYSNPASVKRGDIVVFVREQDGQKYDYIWRVIGLPGETIVASGESLIINGQSVPRQRLGAADDKTIFREQIGNTSYAVAFESSPHLKPPDVAITVPADHFFVMGDNRFSAYDSRHFGAIPFSSIIGRKL